MHIASLINSQKDESSYSSLLELNENQYTTTIYSWQNDDHEQCRQIKHSKHMGKKNPNLTFYNFNGIINHISCGDEHTAFISNGYLYTMGNNLDGRLGIGQKNLKYLSTPCLVQSLARFKTIKIACGAKHCAAIIESGELFTWGFGGDGQLGLGNLLSQYFPQSVPLIGSDSKRNNNDILAKEISCGYNHTAMITVTGEIFTWGANDQGQLGQGKNIDYNLPCKLKNFNESMEQIACGINYTLFLSSFGRIYGCGSNYNYQLALKEKKIYYSPMKITALEQINITKISAGYHSAAITSKGEVFIWGIIALREFSIPRMITIEHPIIDLKMGGNNITMILDKKGIVWELRKNVLDQLGNHDNESKRIVAKVDILNGKRVYSLACGKNYVIALENIIKEQKSIELLDCSEINFEKKDENENNKVLEIKRKSRKMNKIQCNKNLLSDFNEEDTNYYNNIMHIRTIFPKSHRENYFTEDCIVGEKLIEPLSAKSLKKKIFKEKRKSDCLKIDQWEEVPILAKSQSSNRFNRNKLGLCECVTDKPNQQFPKHRETLHGSISKRFNTDDDWLDYEDNDKISFNNHMKNYACCRDGLKNALANMKILAIQNNLLTNELQQKSKQIVKLESKIKKLKEFYHLIKKSNSTVNLATSIMVTQNSSKDKETKILELQEQINKLIEENKKQKEELMNKNEEITEKNKQIDTFMKEIDNHKSIISNLQDERKNFKELCRFYQQLKRYDMNYLKDLIRIINGNIPKNNFIINHQSIDLTKIEFRQYYEDQIKNLSEILGIDLNTNNQSPLHTQASSDFLNDKKTTHESNTKSIMVEKTLNNINHNDIIPVLCSTPDELIYGSTAISPFNNSLYAQNHYHERISRFQTEGIDLTKEVNLLKKQDSTNKIKGDLISSAINIKSDNNNNCNDSKPNAYKSKQIQQSNTSKNFLQEQNPIIFKGIIENYKPGNNLYNNNNIGNSLMNSSTNNQENFRKCSITKLNFDMKKFSHPLIETLPIDDEIKQTKKNIGSCCLNKPKNKIDDNSKKKIKHSYSNSISYYQSGKSRVNSARKKDNNELSPRIDNITNLKQGNSLEVHQLYNKLLNLLKPTESTMTKLNSFNNRLNNVNNKKQKK